MLDFSETSSIIGDTKVAVFSLGCPKNLADGEVLMGFLSLNGHRTGSDPEEAEIIIQSTRISVPLSGMRAGSL